MAQILLGMCTIYIYRMVYYVAYTTHFYNNPFDEKKNKLMYKRGRNLRGGCRLRASSALISREYSNIIRSYDLNECNFSLSLSLSLFLSLSLTVMSNSFNRFYFLPSPFLVHILLLSLLVSCYRFDKSSHTGPLPPKLHPHTPRACSPTSW